LRGELGRERRERSKGEEENRESGKKEFARRAKQSHKFLQTTIRETAKNAAVFPC
jgi:hypothetical protein